MHCRVHLDAHRCFQCILGGRTQHLHTQVLNALDRASMALFLTGIGSRALRLAEAGLHLREDALDTAQDAMTKLLAYRDRPAAETAQSRRRHASL